MIYLSVATDACISSSVIPSVSSPTPSSMMVSPRPSSISSRTLAWMYSYSASLGLTSAAARDTAANSALLSASSTSMAAAAAAKRLAAPAEAELFWSTR